VFASRWIAGAFYFVLFISSLSLLQNYRDKTRYVYYGRHSDMHQIPKQFVNGWEFIDRMDEHKVIAFTRGYKQPNHEWFFYPLLGRRLQNDITYLSALHKWEVPTWADKGMLRGIDPDIWFYNLKKKKVDYIFVQDPWPVELGWINKHMDDFALKYIDRYCRIYKYTGKY
jgi:hypothetical protein